MMQRNVAASPQEERTGFTCCLLQRPWTSSTRRVPGSSLPPPAGTVYVTRCHRGPPRPPKYEKRARSVAALHNVTRQLLCLL